MQKNRKVVNVWIRFQQVGSCSKSVTKTLYGKFFVSAVFSDYFVIIVRVVGEQRFVVLKGYW